MYSILHVHIHVCTLQYILHTLHTHATHTYIYIYTYNIHVLHVLHVCKILYICESCVIIQYGKWFRQTTPNKFVHCRRISQHNWITKTTTSTTTTITTMIHFMTLSATAHFIRIIRIIITITSFPKKLQKSLTTRIWFSSNVR